MLTFTQRAKISGWGLIGNFLILYKLCTSNIIFSSNRHFPNLLGCTRNNSMKSRRAMISILIWRVSLSASFSYYCVVCTETNSGSVYRHFNITVVKRSLKLRPYYYDFLKHQKNMLAIRSIPLKKKQIENLLCLLC